MNTQNPTKELTQARLKELLHYDPETGIFTRRVGRGGEAAGSIAGCRHNEGYCKLVLDHQQHLAHRVAFLWMTGVLPTGQVDHINGDRYDNRWVNLREVSSLENTHNIGGPPVTNTSGLLGAFFQKTSGKWFSQIRCNKRLIYLGLHPTAEAAHAAYLKAKDELHPTHRRLRGGA